MIFKYYNSAKSLDEITTYLQSLSSPHTVVVRKPNRTLDQNDKWHAMLDELARASGYTADEMKAIIKQSITNSWLLEMVVTKETAKGMSYTYTISSSDLKVDQMSLLIEYTQQMQMAQSKVMAESVFT